MSAASTGKIVDSVADAVGPIPDKAVVLVGGWGGRGIPSQLIRYVADHAAPGLTAVSNNCGAGHPGDIGQMFETGVIAKVLTTFPVNPGALAFRSRYEAGELELELVPQGTLAERLRAAGAGIGGFFTPTGAGTELAEGKETRTLSGRPQIFETALAGDLALIRAAQADAMGNLRFRFATRAFSPLMAMAGRRTVVQADEIVPVGALAPDDVHLPGIFVDAIVQGEPE